MAFRGNVLESYCPWKVVPVEGTALEDYSP
jgi:hypothetical protein